MRHNEIRPSQWCVYRHRTERGVFYIGSGTGSRAFQTADRGRLWNDAMSMESSFRVEIVAWYWTKQEARARERAEIRRLRPEANAQHAGRVQKTPPTKDGLLTTDELCRRARVKRGSFNRLRDRLGLVPAGETIGSTGVRIQLWDEAVVKELALSKKYGRKTTTE